MKLALLSDLHANLRALDACLHHAVAQGAERFAVLGDLVGYGAQPAEVLTRVRQLAREGALVVQGNHDALAVAPPANASAMDEAGAAWTHGQLGAGDLAFLAGLPLTATEGSAFLVHASADAPQRWRYVDNAPQAEASLDAACRDPRVRYVFGGHVHHQTLYFRGAGSRLMGFAPTPGAAGSPRWVRSASLGTARRKPCMRCSMRPVPS